MILSSSDSEKSDNKTSKEKKKKVNPGPVHFGSSEPVILVELDPQVPETSADKFAKEFDKELWLFLVLSVSASGLPGPGSNLSLGPPHSAV